VEQRSLFAEERSYLFEWLCTTEYLKEGFKAVKKNGGSPGIDGITIEEFESRLDEELRQLKEELEGWMYKNQIRCDGLRYQSLAREPEFVYWECPVFVTG